MSFGYSVGDFLLLTQLAYRTVQNARKACSAHDDLAREVSSLHIVLQRVEVEVSKPESILNKTEDNRRKELGRLGRHCERVLKVLEQILDKYNALPDEKRSVTKLWQKIRFGNGEMLDLGKIRAELATHTQALNMFLNLLSIGSQGKVEKYMDSHGEELREIKHSLHWVTASMQANNRDEGSILTTYADDDKAIWKAFRRELVKEGFSSDILRQHKKIIKDYVLELGERGALDEVDVATEDRSTETEGAPTSVVPDETSKSEKAPCDFPADCWDEESEDFLDQDMLTSEHHSQYHPTANDPGLGTSRDRCPIWVGIDRVDLRENAEILKRQLIHANCHSKLESSKKSKSSSNDQEPKIGHAGPSTPPRESKLSKKEPFRFISTWEPETFTSTPDDLALLEAAKAWHDESAHQVFDENEEKSPFQSASLLHSALVNSSSIKIFDPYQERNQEHHSKENHEAPSRTAGLHPLSVLENIESNQTSLSPPKWTVEPKSIGSTQSGRDRDRKVVAIDPTLEIAKDDLIEGLDRLQIVTAYEEKSSLPINSPGSTSKLDITSSHLEGTPQRQPLVVTRECKNGTVQFQRAREGPAAVAISGEPSSDETKGAPTENPSVDSTPETKEMETEFAPPVAAEVTVVDDLSGSLGEPETVTEKAIVEEPEQLPDVPNEPVSLGAPSPPKSEKRKHRSLRHSKRRTPPQSTLKVSKILQFSWRSK